MILISHRGNTNGPDLNNENKPEYILKALSLGYHCEIDVWYQNDTWYLGHDEPTYSVSFDFLLKDNLWLHCKNLDALSRLSHYSKCNAFWHQTDDYTLTTKGYIWVYPGKAGLEGYKCICVMPEWNNQDTRDFIGVCTDYIENYR